jgi:hypothetical protein
MDADQQRQFLLRQLGAATSLPDSIAAVFHGINIAAWEFGHKAETFGDNRRPCPRSRLRAATVERLSGAAVLHPQLIARGQPRQQNCTSACWPPNRSPLLAPTSLPTINAIGQRRASQQGGDAGAGLMTVEMRVVQAPKQAGKFLGTA